MRILDGRRAMTETGEISLTAGEGEARRDARLPDQQRHVLPLVAGTNQVLAARAEK